MRRLDVDRLTEALKVGLIAVPPKVEGRTVGYHTEDHVRRLAKAVAREYEADVAPTTVGGTTDD